MVNTGKASNACAICKKRRIKCDLVKPQCSQCVKSGWICPGSGSETDLTFKDQTAAIARSVSSGRSVKNTPTPRGSGATTPVLTPLRPLSPSTLDHGIAFFMHNYVLQGSDIVVAPFSRGLHEYLPVLVLNDGPFGTLRTIVAAAGLAALSNQGNSGSLQAESYQMYNTVIRQVTIALDDATESQKDYTLAAIMLMGTFEIIASGDAESLKVFANHTMAAAGCIELRGPLQFHGEVSLKLFLDLAPNIVLTCHQLQTRVPAMVESCGGKERAIREPEEHAYSRLVEISAKLAGFRAGIKEQRIEGPSMVISELHALDAELTLWRQELPASWMYTTEMIPNCDSGSFAWQSFYCVYKDLWIATMWNHYRSIRLILHETISRTILTFATGQSHNQLNMSEIVMQGMSEEIYLSVAYLLGQYGSGKDAQVDPTPIPGGYTLLWPLFLAGMSRGSGQAQRFRAAEILQTIGKRMGLKLAMIMSVVLVDQNGVFSDESCRMLGEFYP